MRIRNIGATKYTRLWRKNERQIGVCFGKVWDVSPGGDFITAVMVIHERTRRHQKKGKVQNPKKQTQVIATDVLALNGIMGINLRSYGSVIPSSIRSLEDRNERRLSEDFKALTSPGVETPFVSFTWNWEVNIW
jgi:hypothetical protein